MYQQNGVLCIVIAVLSSGVTGKLSHFRYCYSGSFVLNTTKLEAAFAAFDNVSIKVSTAINFKALQRFFFFLQLDYAIWKVKCDVILSRHSVK